MNRNRRPIFWKVTKAAYLYLFPLHERHLINWNIDIACCSRCKYSYDHQTSHDPNDTKQTAKDEFWCLVAIAENQALKILVSTHAFNGKSP